MIPWLALVGGCSYSFSGVALQPDVETISVKQFTNEAQLIQPVLAPNLTERVRDVFITQSRLKLQNDRAHLRLSGTVTDYTISAVAVQGNEQAASSRLTVAIRVNFENTLYTSESWEQSFSAFIDFPRDAVLAQVEQQLLTDLVDRLAQDVFNKALSNW